MNNICWLLIMERKDSYTLTLEALLQGLIPNATPPAVIKIIDSLIQHKLVNYIIVNKSLFVWNWLPPLCTMIH